MFQFSHADFEAHEMLPARVGSVLSPGDDCPKWLPLTISVVLGFYVGLAAFVLWMLL